MSPSEAIIGVLVSTVACFLMWQWITRDMEGHDD